MHYTGAVFAGVEGTALPRYMFLDGPATLTEKCELFRLYNSLNVANHRGFKLKEQAVEYIQ